MPGFPKDILQPAASYDRRTHKNLFRMVNTPNPGCQAFNFHLSPQAARLVEDKPEVLLHYRLYLGPDGQSFLYMQEGKPVCVVQTEALPIEAGKFVYQVNICTPEEVPADLPMKKEEMSSVYPFPFLPFDLDLATAVIEQTHVKSADALRASAIQLNASAFPTYQLFHFLRHGRSGDFAARLGSIQRILEVGGGLGTISFVATQFLPQARVVSVEIDRDLVLQQGRLQQALLKGGYKVRNVQLRCANVLETEPGFIEGFDALIGWFPLGYGLETRTLSGLLSRMKRGSLLFQLFSQEPLSIDDAEKQGFRYVDFGAVPLAYTVFEKT